MPEITVQGLVGGKEFSLSTGKLALQADGAVVARWLDSCLAIFPMTAWSELAARVGSLPMTDPLARLLQRQLFSGALETELDGQGRVLVPQGLREFAGLETEALVLGSRDHAEIWLPATWATYGQELDDPQELAQAFEGLGI